MDQSVYWIWLQNLKGIHKKDKVALIAKFGRPSSVYENRLKLGLVENLDHAEWIMERHGSLGIQLLTPEHEGYREGMPFAVYYKGRLVEGKSMAVVGTRKCSADGYYYTLSAARKLISEGVCINSGLAIGVDEHAHMEAIKSEGKTQAFVAHGLDFCYPRNHKWMMKRIAERGAVISSFAAETKPMRHRFIERNELMATMSDEVLVIEASKKSGALITAGYAKKLSKKVWSIRGPKDSLRCEGNNRLIDEGAGAFDVERLFWKGPETELLEVLRIAPMSTETLSKLSGMSYNILDMILYDLETHHWLNFKGDGKWHYNGW